jgi:hypothetical protein
MNKLFILLHQLHSFTCFEHYYAHPQELKIVSVQPLVSSLCLGDCSVHRLRDDESPQSVCTEQSPKESDDTRHCTKTI